MYNFSKPIPSPTLAFYHHHGLSPPLKNMVCAPSASSVPLTSPARLGEYTRVYS